MNFDHLMKKLWFRILVLSLVPLVVGSLFSYLFGGFGFVAAGWSAIVANSQINKKYGRTL